MTAPETPGLAQRLGRIVDTSLGLVQTRLALLAVEVEEEGLRIGAALFNIILAALCAAFGLLALAIFITVALWDSHRLLAIGAVTVFFLGLAAWTASNAQRRLKHGKRLFTDSVAEIGRDRAALQDGPAP
ncbi:MAG: phage holin family protein [Moraxellaceae bacterium]|nr:phage holin family protein [Moraxellaceae bacterium]